MEIRLKELADILHVDEILSYPQLEKCDRLILIPHRFLHLLPLHALPLGNRESGRENGEEESSCVPLPCLLDRFSRGVSYAPSCQLLQQAQARLRPQFHHLFAIQNPTEDLTYTDLEVQAIQQYFDPTHILVKGDANKASLAPDRQLQHSPLNTAHCAHFSCHGYFNFKNPLLSALLLAKCQIDSTPDDANPTYHLLQQNGQVIDLTKCLTLADLFTLDLRSCRLVTLSACETGLTDIKSLSDEYIGLTNGFLVAGAPGVVCSLWAVDDISTALLMIRFYQNLQAGLTIAIALNTAQTWLRDATKAELQVWAGRLKLASELFQQIQQAIDWFDSDEQPFQDPIYWAAFCAIGQ